MEEFACLKDKIRTCHEHNFVCFSLLIFFSCFIFWKDFEFYRGLFEREDLGVPEKDTVVRVISTQWFGASIARNRPLREKV